MMPTVAEVMGRSEQGMTKPYICRCDDGEVYFVKGRSATRKGLINEWLCANLAREFGLPIAPFTIANVPEELIDSDLTGWLKELGVGEVFASQKVEATELTHSQIRGVPVQQRQDVLLFDWWIHNEDRCLTAYGGNVNLLWRPSKLTPEEFGLVVIDHNLAFDETFSVEKFCTSHVFAADLRLLFSDFISRHDYQQRFENTLRAVWDSSCHNLPESWGYIDPERTLPTNYPFAQTKAILDFASTSTFWTLPT